MHSFKIRIDGCGRGYVEMDGQRLKGVRAVSLSAECDAVTTVNLSFVADDVDAEVQLDANPMRESVRDV